MANVVETKAVRLDLDVVNPATGGRIGSAPALSAADVAELASRARAAQPGWKALGFDGRAVVLRRMQRWISAHADELIEKVQAETGRVFEDSVLKLAYPLTALGYGAANSARLLRSKRVDSSSPFVLGKKLRAHRLPYGLIGVIAPWNFPITIGFGDSVPAIAVRLVYGTSAKVRNASPRARLAARRVDRGRVTSPSEGVRR